MWDNATIMMLVEGTFVTLYMTLVSTFMGVCTRTSYGNCPGDYRTGRDCVRTRSFIRFWM